MAQEIGKVITDLFTDAQSTGGVQYIYTLLRMTGPEVDRSDALVRLRSELKETREALFEPNLFSLYCSWATDEAPFDLLANLLNCVREKPYSVVPFFDINKGKYPQKIVEATPQEKIKELSRVAAESGREELAQAINEAYPDVIIYACSDQSQPPLDQLRAAFQKCRLFLSTLIEVHFFERLKYRDWHKFHKVSPFEVIELFTNDEYGLYGFRMHFPNAASAEFMRYPESHEGRNFLVQPYHIEYFVGLLDNLQKAWQIDGKRLHELNLTGRYNPMGEWRPIVAPEAVATFSDEARSLTDDPDVQGALFYILSTGFRVIEFVVRTNIDLPHEEVNFGENFHLWKCPPLDETPRSNSNFRIYDGWVDLDSVEPEYVRHAIAMINIALNRMAFAYDASLHWRIKYRLHVGEETLWTPNEEDTHLINSLLKDFPKADDSITIDSSLDWYARGRASHNVFTAFLCYYVALESVASAVAEGKADFGLGFRKETRSERKQARLTCIKETHDALYEKEPDRFVTEAYFNCVVGLKEKTKRITELVFGPEHPYIKLLFKKGEDGHSLYSIRGKLAHGGVTLMDRDHERLVRNRLHEIAEISKEFLTRLIFFLKPEESLPSWSGRFSNAMHFTDPRSTMFVNNEQPIIDKDWRIRSEWCD
jgi:hypothetical protein